MQKTIESKFEVKDWSKDMVALVHTEKYDPPIKGLPPTRSHVIVMDPNEVNDLIKVLQKYANERRNKGVL
jgi:hypothetical protein